MKTISPNLFKITSRYDSVKDITTTLLSPGKQNISDSAGTKLYLLASFAYKGETPTRPRRVFLGIGSLYGLSDVEHTEITLMVEETRQLNLQARVVNTETNGIPLSLVGTYIPSDEFIELTQSARIEVRLQNIRSTLSDEQLAGLRELAGRIPPEEFDEESLTQPGEEAKT